MNTVEGDKMNSWSSWSERVNKKSRGIFSSLTRPMGSHRRRSWRLLLIRIHGGQDLMKLCFMPSVCHFIILKVFIYSGASLMAQMITNLPAMQETCTWSLIGKIPWRREWLTHSSILGYSVDRGAWRAIVHEISKRLTHKHTHSQIVHH